MALDLYPTIIPEKSYQPSAWKPIHRMVVALAVAGYTGNEIAAELKKTPAWVSKILGDPRAELDKAGALSKMADGITNVAKRIEGYQNEALTAAVDVLRETMKPDIQLRAAFGILDRGGNSPVQKSVAVVATVPATPELLANIETTIAQRSQRERKFDVREADYEFVEDEPTLQEELFDE